jgi:peptidoglycan/xylan/chitin deacetylase (PgdA/CDA1 family)
VQSRGKRGQPADDHDALPGLRCLAYGYPAFYHHRSSDAGLTVSLAKFLHKSVSPLLYASGAYNRQWQKRAEQQPFTMVLVYHRVVPDGPVTPGSFNIERGIPASVFEAQLQFMLKHFAPVKGSQVLTPSADHLRFAVTLDDGYEDNFRVAAPILHRLGVPATFFVVSDYVGTDRLFWWEQLATMVRASRAKHIDLQTAVPSLVDTDRLPATLALTTDAERVVAYERISAALRSDPHASLFGHLDRLAEGFEVRASEEGRSYGLMSWDQLRKLVRQGFEIGGHTASHCNVVDASTDMLQHEIISSVTTIQHELNEPIRTFAYPYGMYRAGDNVMAKILADAGCEVAFTAENAMVDDQTNHFEVPRSHLNRRYDFACAYNVQDALSRTPPR